MQPCEASGTKPPHVITKGMDAIDQHGMQEPDSAIQKDFLSTVYLGTSKQSPPHSGGHKSPKALADPNCN